MATQAGSIDLYATNAVRLLAEAGFESAEGKYATKSELQVAADGISLSVSEYQSISGWAVEVASSAPDITSAAQTVTLTATVYKDGEVSDVPLGWALKWYRNGSVVAYGSTCAVADDARYICRLEG